MSSEQEPKHADHAAILGTSPTSSSSVTYRGVATHHNMYESEQNPKPADHAAILGLSRVSSTTGGQREDNIPHNIRDNVPHNIRDNIPHNIRDNIPHNIRDSIPHNIRDMDRAELIAALREEIGEYDPIVQEDFRLP